MREGKAIFLSTFHHAILGNEPEEGGRESAIMRAMHS